MVKCGSTKPEEEALQVVTTEFPGFRQRPDVGVIRLKTVNQRTDRGERADERVIGKDDVFSSADSWVRAENCRPRSEVVADI